MATGKVSGKVGAMENRNNISQALAGVPNCSASTIGLRTIPPKLRPSTDKTFGYLLPVPRVLDHEFWTRVKSFRPVTEEWGRWVK